jgi:hypothetical protein
MSIYWNHVICTWLSMNIYSTLLKFLEFYATHILFKTTHEYSWIVWIVWIPWVFLAHTGNGLISQISRNALRPSICSKTIVGGWLIEMASIQTRDCAISMHIPRPGNLQPARSQSCKHVYPIPIESRHDIHRDDGSSWAVSHRPRYSRSHACVRGGAWPY